MTVDRVPPPATRPALPRRQHGVSLIEIMVAVVIGLLAVLVIYQVFAVSEGFKRNTTGASDAQQTGLFSMFTLGIEIANAGNSISLAAAELSTCPNTGDPATTLRPIPVLIIPGKDDNTPDGFIVNYSTSRTLTIPVNFLAQSPANNQFVVQSPNGFAVGNRVIAVQQSTGKCTISTLVDRSPKMPPAEAPLAGGKVTVTTATPAAADFMAITDVDPSRLIDMGPAGSPQRVLYDVQKEVLRSTDLLTAGAVASPLASNVINVKVQYGIDTSAPPDNILDTWVPATDAAWTSDAVMAGNLAKLTQIKAIRIGLIVRSEQYDRDVTAKTPWTLFDCPTHDNTCPGRLTGTLDANWRYRTYETVIPLRNQLWNGPAAP